jgi:hypothetical protein
MKSFLRLRSGRSASLGSCILLALCSWCAPIAGLIAAETDLWSLAQRESKVHRFSTLFTAQDVRDRLKSESGREQAIDWCKKTGVTRVFIETFRDGYQADLETLQTAKQAFLTNGFLVSGCITPTRVGKPSTGWNLISCYTDLATQRRIRSVFEFSAGLFDEIMIDDFWFTDCACAQCNEAREAKRVLVGEKEFRVSGDSWEDYRCELMVRVSQEHLLRAAKKANPGARLIIKYPQWYDRFHERGYEVIRQTADFDKIWVGTETRDYLDSRWGGTVQYEAYFIMRWLGGIGVRKCGGGWYDSLGTTEKTYVEQARQTVLAGAAESMLFAFGGLQRDQSAKDVQALRANIPELLAVAKEVRKREPVGIAAYKPANSHPEKEPRVFDFVGMLGLPLVPCHEFPVKAPAAFFSLHALKDPGFEAKFDRFLRAGKPVLITDGLAERLAGRVKLDLPSVRVLPVKGEPKSLLNLDEATLDALRKPLLTALSRSFAGPNSVVFYAFKDGSWVVENFNDYPAKTRIGDETVEVEARGWRYLWK